MIPLEMLWAWSGTLYLVILYYQDMRNNRQIDDRLNYLMLGMTTCLLSIVTNYWWYNLFIIFFSIFIGWAMNRFKLVGEGDSSAFRWSFFGFGLLGLNHLLAYLIMIILFSGVYAILKFAIFKYNRPLPFIPVVLTIFIGNCIAGSFY